MFIRLGKKMATEKEKKTAGGSISLRLDADERAELQAQADELEVSLTSIIKLRIGATSGITLLLKDLDKRFSRFEQDAKDMNRVGLMVEKLFELAHENASKEQAWKTIGERLRQAELEREAAKAEAEAWRAEAAEVATTIKALAKTVEQLAGAVKAGERE